MRPSARAARLRTAGAEPRSLTSSASTASARTSPIAPSEYAIRRRILSGGCRFGSRSPCCQRRLASSSIRSGVSGAAAAPRLAAPAIRARTCWRGPREQGIAQLAEWPLEAAAIGDQDREQGHRLAPDHRRRVDDAAAERGPRPVAELRDSIARALGRGHGSSRVQRPAHVATDLRRGRAPVRVQGHRMRDHLARDRIELVERGEHGRGHLRVLAVIAQHRDGLVPDPEIGIEQRGHHERVGRRCPEAVQS